MSILDLESLLRKDKRSAAVVLLREFKDGDRSEYRLLTEFMSNYLNVKKSIADSDVIEAVKSLIASGMTFEEFSTEVKKYDVATTCGLVWIHNFIAYRCRTCAISPCMSLCARCFNNGNHEGHDFNMFKSLAGGACDCGDSSVIKPSGFCKNHRPVPDDKIPVPPPKLLFLAKGVIPHLLNRFLWELRQPKLENPMGIEFFIDNVFNPLTAMGAQMRKLISESMIDPSIYSSLAHNMDSDDLVIKNILTDRHKNYIRAKQKMQILYKPELTFYRDQEFFTDVMKKALDKELNHQCFVDEYLFWTIHHEFPERLVCFLLKMLPEKNYRLRIAESFVDHYSRLSTMLAVYQGNEEGNKSPTLESLSNCVVHVSVQLFSNEPIAVKLCENQHLLQVIIGSLRAIFEGQRCDSPCLLIPSQMHDKTRNKHMVIDCDHHIMKTHAFWPIVSDLTNLLVHTPVAVMFMKSSELLDSWLQYMMDFQGMNLNTRETLSHVEFEGDSYYAAFSAELEICATFLWTLMSHLKDESTVELTKKVIKFSQKYIEEWFKLINFSSSDVPDPNQATFHIPLHRYYSLFLQHGVQFQGLSLKEFLPPSHLLKAYLAHPLQLQINFYEILAGLWVRNGHQMKGQAMTYIECHFCNSMVDPDLFLIQQIAAYLDPDWFIQTVFERFHVWDWLSFDYNPTQPPDSDFVPSDQVVSILEGALTFLATLFSININLGLSETEVLRKEMVTLLSMSDRTHSQLLGLLPERCGSFQNKGFEKILDEISEFSRPTLESNGHFSQGMFHPRPDIWENEYDPIHVLLRAVHRRDFQSSLNRFIQHVKSSSKSQNISQAKLWPPFRLPKDPDNSKFLDARKVLYSKVLHGAIFTILYKAVHSNNIPDQVLALTIYILELALRFPVPDSDSPVVKLDGAPTQKSYVPDLKFDEWFNSHSITENMNHTIQSVTIYERRPGSLLDLIDENGPSIEEMDVDMYLDNSDDTDDDAEVWIDPDCCFTFATPPLVMPPLASRSERLALTSNSFSFQESSTSTALVPSINLDISPNSTADENPSVNPQPASSSSSSPSSSSSSSQLSSSSSSSSSSLSSSSSSSSSANSLQVPGTNKTPQSQQLSALLHERRMLRMVNRSRSRNVERMPYTVMDQIGHITDMMKALPSSTSPYFEIVPINESILSLLLKLHSKFTAQNDSYRPSQTVSESRIGDGAHFVKVVLDLYCKSNVSSGVQSIDEWRNKIWPSTPLEDSSSPHSSQTEKNKPSIGQISQPDKDEKRRKAKERQQKLMAEFANKQKAFINKMEAMKSAKDDEVPVETKPIAEACSSSLMQAQSFECIICGQSSPSTLKELIGMVVLLQPTNIWGHSTVRHLYERPCESRSLPCSTEEEINWQCNEHILKSYMSKRIDDFVFIFDPSSWLHSMNIGWEGGVHVQSCGHYIHLDCHKRYIQSLHDTRQPNRNSVEGEFYCPLCRQLANSILPINPGIKSCGAVAKYRKNEPQTLEAEIMDLLCNIQTSDKDLMQKFITFCEDLTKATPAQYRSPRIHPSTESLFSFMCSIIRTNLECELIAIMSNSTPIGVKKSCFVPLFHVLALQARVLVQHLFTRFSCLWSQLTGIEIPKEFSLSLTLKKDEVPLLLRDPISLLILLFSLLPLNVEKSYFSCVTQVLYNLTLVQALAQITLSRPDGDFNLHDLSFSSLPGLMKFVHVSFENVNRQTPTKPSFPAQLFSHLIASDSGKTQVEEASSEESVKKLCLPFMRIAALLQSHLYNEHFPNEIVNEKEKEFEILAKFLSLRPNGVPHWVKENPSSLIETWITDFSVLFRRNLMIARRLLQNRPIDVYRPSLLRLPKTYDQIFLFYHQKSCKNCNKMAKEPCICLVCGTLVCLKDECCRYPSTDKHEAIAHADTCGAGTTIYLAVNSSNIIVIRGKRACSWGSVYLDAYGEEDKDLKRGKPLYLCEQRYFALEQQWLTHSFDHTNKRWMFHKETL